jgi:Tfp pilus assembly protein PilZ
VNRLGYSDAEQLAWATTQGRVLYSFNVKDFCRLHAQILAEDNNHHTGIVVVPRQSYSIGDQVRGLLNIADLSVVNSRIPCIAKVYRIFRQKEEPFYGSFSSQKPHSTVQYWQFWNSQREFLRA